MHVCVIMQNEIGIENNVCFLFKKNFSSHLMLIHSTWTLFFAMPAHPKKQ